MNMALAAKQPDARARRSATLRFALGQAQMGGAVLTAVLLLSTGTSKVTLILAGVTTALTLTSVLIFRVIPRLKADHGKR